MSGEKFTLFSSKSKASLPNSASSPPPKFCIFSKSFSASVFSIGPFSNTKSQIEYFQYVDICEFFVSDKILFKRTIKNRFIRET